MGICEESGLVESVHETGRCSGHISPHLSGGHLWVLTAHFSCGATFHGAHGFVKKPRHNDFREGRLTSGSYRGLADCKPEPPYAKGIHTNSEVSHAPV
jgi:hypothetical protein